MWDCAISRRSIDGTFRWATATAAGGLRHQNFRIASYLSNWRVEIDVYYVSNTDLTTALASGLTSNYRAVEVRVYINDPNGARRLLTTLRRVFAYVPSS